MSSLTPNYGLEKPAPNEPFENFLPSYNRNMDKIDENMGGGGSGGHTIVDESGANLPSESKLQFTDGLQAVDDNVNGKTVVSLAYFAVVNGELCQVYDDGN